MRYQATLLYHWGFWLLVLAGGLAVSLAPIVLPGIVLGGSACGGGGSEQVCLGIARELTLVDISPRAWVWVAGGGIIAAIAAAALLVPVDHVRLGAAVLVLGLAATGVAQTAEVDEKLGPSGGGTWGRADEEWGPFLRPALLALRADKRRELVGTRQRPGAPPYEREQTLETFSALPRTGWTVLESTLAALLFSSLFEVARRAVRRPSLALLIALTAGAVLWAGIEDHSYECNPDASECYRGLGTFLAVIAAALAWAAYGIGVAAGRLRRPRPPRRPE